MAALDKGRKNVELLKQAQYQPMAVEKQVALIYCGTKGLLRDVPQEKVKAFEQEFIDTMELRHAPVMTQIAEGQLNDQITRTLEEVARDVALHFQETKTEDVDL